MKLQTKLKLQIQAAKNQIDYNSQILLVGSCFAENIAAKLEYYKFKQLCNPQGILFHPKAIENFISKAVHQHEYGEDAVFLHNEVWSSFEAHSKLNSLNEDDLIGKLNTSIKETHQQILNATHIVFTLGTAWVYQFLETGCFVANCHKVPQKAFEKSILDVAIIYKSLERTVSEIRRLNINTNIIFTISPVRHLKDGFIENQQSKAHLVAALHQFLKQSIDDKLHYFESYELVLDELRDYRFFKEDMLHPNNLAVDYIWERFAEVWVTAHAQLIMKEVKIIQQALSHKPFNVHSVAYQKFNESLSHKIEVLKEKCPSVNFS